MTNAPFSRNPADNDSMVGMFRLVLTKFLQGVDDMLPAQVIAYDRPSNRAQVQPLIQMVTTNNERVNRAQIASVPVLQLGGGGFVMSFPIASGDLGWIKANDRDISLFKTTYALSAPNTQRKHDFSDALFIPDAMLNIALASEDAGNAVFQNTDGTVKIALWPTLIKILATAGVGIGGTPAPGTILDVQSINKAFVPPRMSTEQRDSIPDPFEGMTIYNLSEHRLETYTDTGWPT